MSAHAFTARCNRVCLCVAKNTEAKLPLPRCPPFFTSYSEWNFSVFRRANVPDENLISGDVERGGSVDFEEAPLGDLGGGEATCFGEGFSIVAGLEDPAVELPHPIGL